MLSVIDVMKATEGFVRSIREGEEVLKSGLVISVGKKGYCSARTSACTQNLRFKQSASVFGSALS